MTSTAQNFCSSGLRGQRLGRRDAFRGRGIGTGPFGGSAEVLERRDATELSLGVDRCSELVQVDGLRVGDHDQVDEVLDAAAALAAGILGVHRRADLIGNLVDNRVKPVGKVISGRRRYRRLAGSTTSGRPTGGGPTTTSTTTVSSWVSWSASIQAKE